MISFADLAHKLRSMREACGLTQDEAASLSGIGVKTLSSFETGARSHSIKLRQLSYLLSVYQIGEAEFFAKDAETLAQRVRDRYVQEHRL